MRTAGQIVGITFLAMMYLAAAFAGFIAPYDYAEQNRDFPYAPPTRIHFGGSESSSRWRPFACIHGEPSSNVAGHEDNRETCLPLKFFVSGSRYGVLGIFTSNRHLFGFRGSARIFLLGSDAYGRDVFSRLLYGGQISLLSGLLATVLSLTVGSMLGVVAGYYAGLLDALIMRSAELFLALPWIYLLLTVRASLPLHVSTKEAFMMLIVLIGLVGWSRPARLVRGVVLSTKERHYIFAARIFGGSDSYLMRRHIFPETWSVLLTQATILVPQYTLAEVTLSFLGLGVAEPTPSWGNMLASLQQYHVLVSDWWMWAPGILLILVFLSYMILADTLHRAGAAYGI